MTSAVSVGMSSKEGGVVKPTVSNAPVAPHGLLDVVSCSCSAERKACSSTATARGDARCSHFNKHTDEDELPEYMQEDERERLTMMNDL